MTYLYPGRSSPDLFLTALPSVRLRWHIYEKLCPKFFHSSINVSMSLSDSFLKDIFIIISVKVLKLQQESQQFHHNN